VISWKRALSWLVSVTAISTMVGGAGPARAARLSAGGSLQLIAATPELTVQRPPDRPAVVDAGVFVAARGGPFQVDIQRKSYDDPVTLTELITVEGTTYRRPLPGTVPVDWAGLVGFLHVVVTDDGGNVVQQTPMVFCPDSWDFQRVGPGGPDQPSFPEFCSTNAFTLSNAWGIDRDWGVDPFEQTPIRLNVPDGHYSVAVDIAPKYANLFHVSPADATASVGVTVVTITKACARPCSGHRRASPSSPLPDVPTMTSPPPDALPDMVALPAWGMSLQNGQGHSLLDFGATVWIGGNSQLDVEGFRRPGTEIMDAIQYFYEDGQVVGQAPAGTFNWDPRPGHEHWHFTQFATYSLLRVSTGDIIHSEKQGFCIAPTDGIDLLLPHATWRPDSIGFYSNCGGPASIWIRETLPLGWGDTYFQSVPGQSFDITDVPNGVYQIEVVANPQHLLYETDSTNDSSFRTVVLGGTPGKRWALIPAWHGLDDEGCIGACP